MRTGLSVKDILKPSVGHLSTHSIQWAPYSIGVSGVRGVGGLHGAGDTSAFDREILNVIV